MTKGNKTRSQLILDALFTGKTLLLSDINRMISEASRKEIRLQDFSSLMAKLTNSRQYKFAHFINRNKTPQGYEYSLVPEILNLASVHLAKGLMTANLFFKAGATKTISQFA